MRIRFLLSTIFFRCNLESFVAPRSLSRAATQCWSTEAVPCIVNCQGGKKWTLKGFKAQAWALHQPVCYVYGIFYPWIFLQIRWLWSWCCGIWRQRSSHKRQYWPVRGLAAWSKKFSTWFNQIFSVLYWIFTVYTIQFTEYGLEFSFTQAKWKKWRKAVKWEKWINEDRGKREQRKWPLNFKTFIL